MAPDLLARVQESVQSVIRGKDEVIQLALVGLLARGHLLIEDVPGVGKTTLAHALARSFNCAFQRIQFTSDMLPSDVIGISVFSQQTQRFEFRPGRSSPISSWPTKSTALRPKPRVPCWKP